MDGAPVLHKLPKEENNAQEIIDFLEKIDSRLGDMPSKISKSRKSENVDLEKFIAKINEKIEKVEKLKTPKNIPGISKKDLESIEKIQSRNIKRLVNSITTSFEDIKDDIFNKDEITEIDKANLIKLTEIEKKFNEQHVVEESPIQDLKDTIASFVDTRENGADINGLSKVDSKKFLRQQRFLDAQREKEIKEKIANTRKELLSKSKLSDTDKQVLSQLKNYEIALKSQYGVKQKFRDTDFGSKFEPLIEKLDKFTDGVKSGSKQVVDEIAKGVLGPLNLIVEPLSDLFGIKFSDLFGNNEFTKKGKKIKPRRSDIIKSNPETVWAVDEQKRIADNSKKEKNKDGSGPVDFLAHGAGKELRIGLAKGALSLLTSPVGIAILAGAAVAGGLKIAGDINQARREKEATEEMGDYMEKTGLTAAQIVELNNVIPMSTRGGFSKEDVAAQMEDVTKHFGITQQQFLDYLEENKNVIGGDVELYKQHVSDIIKSQTPPDVNITVEKVSEDGVVSVESLPKFHKGGLVPGDRNTEVPAMLLGRERVLTERDADEFDKRGMDVNIAQLKNAMATSFNSDGLSKLLQGVIDAINKKPFNNVSQTIVSQSTDFDSLRRALL